MSDYVLENRNLLASLMVAASLVGCGGGGDTTSTASSITVNSAAAIAQVSDPDYANNENGLITATTLKTWKDNWATAKVGLGITGKLIIFQVSTGPAGAEFIKPITADANVRTYWTNASAEWVQTRTNGVINTQSMVPDGATMDALLAEYNIDPRNDMVVVAMGTGSTGNAMGQGRIWYALRYWGMDKTHLALLNGGNQWIVNGTDPQTTGWSAADFQTTATNAVQGTGPGGGTISIRTLLTDNTALQATVQDMINILPGADTNVKTDGVFLWDARSLGQYSAGMKAEWGENVDIDGVTAGTQACNSTNSPATPYCTPADTANYGWTFQNNGSRQGHPRGAVQLQFTYLLDSTKGYAYKDKATLETYLAGGTDASGIGFVDGSNATLGTGNGYQAGDTVYTYCETTFRAMITGVASAVVLGYPTRFYDGAMVEWNSLSNLQDLNGNYILPADSPWRTDLVSFYRSMAGVAPSSAQVAVNTRTITNAYAGSANTIVNTDRAYKTGESVSTGGGGSGGVPSNPCGG